MIQAPMVRLLSFCGVPSLVQEPFSLPLLQLQLRADGFRSKDGEGLGTLTWSCCIFRVMVQGFTCWY